MISILQCTESATHTSPTVSRALYQSLFQKSPPSVHPPNWTRSRIRRQHLITLGVPVNLDEVLPHASSKPLPALHISGGRPMSAPPVSRNGSQTPNGHNSRAGTPVQSASPTTTGSSRKGAAAQLGLGPKPQLDEQRIGELLALNPGTYLFRVIFTISMLAGL